MILKKYLVLSLFCSVSAMANELVTYTHRCDDIIDPTAALIQVKPHYNEANRVQGLDFWGMRHKFDGFTSFSNDGQYVVLHHDIYPQSEQISVRKVETGELMGSLVWRGTGDGFADLQSAAVDGASGQLVAHGYSGSGQREDLVIWNFIDGGEIERVALPLMEDAHFQDANGNWSRNSILAYSEVSGDHPYLLRLRYRAGDYGSRPSRFSVQLINWRTKGLLQVRDTHPMLQKHLASMNVINAKFQFAAIPSSDLKTVNVMSFAKLEQEMGTVSAPRLTGRKALMSLVSGAIRRGGPPAVKAPEEFVTPLVHDKPIKRMEMVPWAPLVVTQTENGLVVWNAKTGVVVARVPEAVNDFRVFSKMGVIAYVLPNKQVSFYSILQGKTLATLGNFKHYSLQYSIEHWSPGVAFVVDENGQVFKISEVMKDRQGEYKFESLDLKVATPLNRTSRSVIRTNKDEYFIVIEADPKIEQPRKSLRIHIYSMSTKALVKMHEYQVTAFQDDFAIDSSHTRVLMTASETETGIINLPNLLRDLGL